MAKIDEEVGGVNQQFEGMKQRLQQLAEVQKLFGRMATRNGSAAPDDTRGGRDALDVFGESALSALSFLSESDKDSEGVESESSGVKHSVGKDDFTFKKAHSRKRHVSYLVLLLKRLLLLGKSSAPF